MRPVVEASPSTFVESGVHLSPTSMRRTLLTELPKHKPAMRSRNKPQQHIYHVNPRRALHLLLILSLQITIQILLPKDAETHDPEEENHRVEVEEDPGLDDGNHPDESEKRAEGAAEDGVDPGGVVAVAAFGGGVQVRGVKTDDDESHDELEEAEEEAEGAADAEVGEDGCFCGGFFAAQGVFGEEA